MLNEKNVPFVGRKEEINLLMSMLSPLLFGKGATVIVSGESGLGKTRLLEEFLRLAENTECQIRSVRNLPGRVAPFSPFISAFTEFENIFRLVEGYGDKYDSSNIYFDFLHVLRKMSYDRPLILVIEDVQWADTQSINLIQFLSRNIDDNELSA
jgi:predicted ATPase